MADPDGTEDADGVAPGLWEFGVPGRAPLTWQGLTAHGRALWFDRLWLDVCMLRDRYGLPIRARWWEDQIQVEALAALAAWVDRYDSGEWDDPPGKLALLFDLERVASLLCDGGDPFHPDRDRRAFDQHVATRGASNSAESIS